MGARTVSRCGAALAGLVLATATVAAATAVPQAGAAPAPARPIGHVSIAASQTPAYAGDAPDPDVVYSGGTYYAFTTGTTLGNNIQALVDTTGNPASGWGSYTGTTYGSTALPSPPAWQEVDTQTSPGVFYYGGHWVMWYDASEAGHAEDSGYSCLSVATAASLTPTSPQFTDTSTSAEILPPRRGPRSEPLRRSRHRGGLPDLQVQ